MLPRLNFNKVLKYQTGYFHHMPANY